MQAEKITLDAIDDLEASETPESVMLSTVSEDQSKDRTDRAVVTPWLKFLWETYRTVLDILRNNARLEVMYQQTAHQAFHFCLKYTRKTEFRRLCELLRNHLQNAAKYTSQSHAINLNDPDTLQRHLDTRFAQLNAAVELELWQEAFRSAEDIHNLLTLSKRPPKPSMMANYYEKMTKIFLVSENYLFHAAAWNRYFQLGMQHKAGNDQDLVKAANFVLLSALAIPVISTSRSKGVFVQVDDAKHKSNRLASLLTMGKTPMRSTLLKDALSKPILDIVSPRIKELFRILEVQFHPLSICKKISPIINEIAKDPETAQYIKPLRQVILTRLFQQLSQVYETVQLDFVISLACFPAPFELSSADIEKFIMRACKKTELTIRIDHSTSVLTFESDVFSSSKSLESVRLQATPAEIVRSRLSSVAKALQSSISVMDVSYKEQKAAVKQAAFQRAVEGADAEHEEAICRRSIIERRKELAESAALQKEKDEATKRALKQAAEAEAEQKRLADEARKREVDRIKKDQDTIRVQEAKKLADELKAKGGLRVDIDDLQNMDADSLRMMQLTQLEKEKRELTERLRITSKRIDHIERAFRREERPLLEQDYERQKQSDKAAHELKEKTQVELAKRRHQATKQLRGRLSRIVPEYDSFAQKIFSKQQAAYEQKVERAKADFEVAKKARIAEVKEEREARRRAQEEEERIRQEEEKLRQEEEEKLAQEKEEQAKAEAERNALHEQKEKQRAEEAR